MKKKRYKLKKWVKISMIVLLTILLYQPLRTDDISETVIRKKKLLKNRKEIIVEKSKKEDLTQRNIVQEEQQEEEKIEELSQQDIQEERQDTSYTTRMTSYYPNDGPGTGSITGSGLGPNDFQINEYGWYTYQDKLVIATATEYLLKYGYTLGSGIHTYKYYDELILNIDGMDYQAIVLDSCGSSMSTGRIDLFVTDKDHIKDVEIIVKNE